MPEEEGRVVVKEASSVVAKEVVEAAVNLIQVHQ